MRGLRAGAGGCSAAPACAEIVLGSGLPSTPACPYDLLGAAWMRRGCVTLHAHTYTLPCLAAVGQVCPPSTKWLVVTNGDNEYSENFFQMVGLTLVAFQTLHAAGRWRQHNSSGPSPLARKCLAPAQIPARTASCPPAGAGQCCRGGFAGVRLLLALPAAHRALVRALCCLARRPRLQAQPPALVPHRPWGQRHQLPAFRQGEPAIWHAGGEPQGPRTYDQVGRVPVRVLAALPSLALNWMGTAGNASVALHPAPMPCLHVPTQDAHWHHPARRPRLAGCLLSTLTA